MHLPFILCRSQELVNDNLGSVGEIAKLRFPNHQGLWARHGISVVVAQYCILAQVRIVDGKAAFLVRYLVDEADLFFRIFQLDDGVAVAKRSTLYVLTRNTDIEAVLEQRAIGHHFRHAPVQCIALKGHGSAVANEANYFVEEFLAFWKRGEGFGYPIQSFTGHLGRRNVVHIAILCGGEVLPFVQHEGNDDVLFNFFGRVKLAFQHVLELVLHLLHQRLGHLAFRE